MTVFLVALTHHWQMTGCPQARAHGLLHAFPVLSTQTQHWNKIPVVILEGIVYSWAMVNPSNAWIQGTNLIWTQWGIWKQKHLFFYVDLFYTWGIFYFEFCVSLAMQVICTFTISSCGCEYSVFVSVLFLNYCAFVIWTTLEQWSHVWAPVCTEDS